MVTGLGFGSAALVTGAGSGIGRAVALALAKRGVNVTVVDYCEAGGQETVRLVEEEFAQHHQKQSPEAPPAIYIQCDVSVPAQLIEAFVVHERTYGRLDILLNNAGIGDGSKFWDDESSDGTGRWRKVVDVNLSAVIDSTRLGIQVMRRTCRSGVILNIASAVGLYPSHHAPVYSATKGGVVMLTRSLAGLTSEGIRVNALCPEHVETNLTKSLPKHVIKDGYISIDKILKGIFTLIEDETQAGACLWLTNRRGAEYWPSQEEKAKYEVKHREDQTSILSCIKAKLPAFGHVFGRMAIREKVTIMAGFLSLFFSLIRCQEGYNYGRCFLLDLFSKLSTSKAPKSKNMKPSLHVLKGKPFSKRAFGST